MENQAFKIDLLMHKATNAVKRLPGVNLFGKYQWMAYSRTSGMPKIPTPIKVLIDSSIIPTFRGMTRSVFRPRGAVTFASRNVQD